MTDAIQPWTRFGLVGVSVIAAGALGAITAFNPMIAAACLAGAALAAVVHDARVQIGIVLVGGVVLLQQGGQLTPVKLAYFVIAGGVVLNATVKYVNLRETATGRSAALLVTPALVLLGMLGLSYFVAAGNGQAPSDWLRDSSPYLLLAAAPFLAVSLRASSSPAFVKGLILATGGIATISFSIYWTSVRGLPGYGSESFLLSSFYLPAALFAYATAAATQERRRGWIWGLLAVGVLSLMLLTGTRTALIFLVAPVVLLIAFTRRGSALGRIAVVLLTFVVGWTVVLPAAGISTEQATQRLDLTRAAIANPAADKSLMERARTTEAARLAWEKNRIVGVGPGHAFQWSTISNEARSSFVIDSPFSYVAKFGVLGLLFLGVAAIALARFCHERLRDPRTRVGATALMAFIAIAIAGVPLGTPLEDKGFAFGFLLLLTLALPDRSNSPAE